MSDERYESQNRYYWRKKKKINLYNIKIAYMGSPLKERACDYAVEIVKLYQSLESE